MNNRREQNLRALQRMRYVLNEEVYEKCTSLIKLLENCDIYDIIDRAEDEVELSKIETPF